MKISEKISDDPLWTLGTWTRPTRNSTEPHDLNCFIALSGTDRKVTILKATGIIDSADDNNDLSFVEQQQCFQPDVHTRTIRSLDFNCDGLMALASFDSTVSIWRPVFPSGNENAAVQYEMICTLEGHENEVKSVAWSPSGNMLATCGRDKSVWIWMFDQENDIYDGDDGFECIAVLQEHSQDVKMVKWHPIHHNVLFSCSYDNTVKVWTEDGDEEWYCAQTLTEPEESANTVWALDFNEDGSLLFCVDGSGRLNIWKTSPGTFSNYLKLETIPVHCGPLYSISVHNYYYYNSSSDSSNNNSTAENLLVAVGGEDGVAIIEYEAANHYRQHKIEHEGGDVNCVRWLRHRDETGEKLILLFCCDDGLLNVLDVLRLLHK